jgi:hypothetical protein
MLCDMHATIAIADNGIAGSGRRHVRDLQLQNNLNGDDRDGRRGVCLWRRRGRRLRGPDRWQSLAEGMAGIVAHLAGLRRLTAARRGGPAVQNKANSDGGTRAKCP